LCFIFATLDRKFEDGMWAWFPPAPGVLVWITQHLVWWAGSDQWKYGACDRYGNPQPLYAVPVVQESK
jgi:hypothetical protein